MTTGHGAARESRELPLGLLDRPDLDARVERSAEFLDALTHSIAEKGVLVPLIVVRTGERYEIVDGFTRYLCANRAGLVAVPCLVYPDKSVALEGVKYIATAFHENFSPADEAIFFRQLLETECGGDVEKLCLLVNRRESYVLDRLDLTTYDDKIFEALKARQIGVGVAKRLQSVPDESYRRYYLTHAIRDGATETTVSGWVQQWHSMFDGVPVQATPAASETPIVIPQGRGPHFCYLCKKSDSRFIPEQLPVHTHCRLAILDVLLGNADAEVEPV